MKTKGRRQSTNVVDQQKNPNTSAQAASASIGNETYPTQDNSVLSNQVGAQNMGAAAYRDRVKNSQSPRRTRTRMMGDQATPYNTVERLRGMVLEKMGKPTSDGVTKDRLR